MDVATSGAITKSSIQGPRCPPHHCPAPASAEVCGDDVNSEHGGGGYRDQPVAALDPRDTSVYCLQCLTHSKSGSGTVLMD